MTKSVKKILQRAICISACILLIFGMKFFSRNPGLSIEVGIFKISYLGVVGALASLSAFICYLMVFVDCNIGAIIGFLTILLETLFNIISIKKSHSLNSLPGLISCAASIMTLLIIARFYRRTYRASFTDSLTGLKNRRNFIYTLQDKFKQEKTFTLAYIEIMNFKSINNTLGIQVGDDILKKAASFLTAQISKNDLLFRMTGVTFMIIFDEKSDVETTLKKIMSLEDKPVNLSYSNTLDKSLTEEQTVRYKFAIGVSKYPDNSKDFDSIIRHADLALTYAQKQPDIKICMYNDELENEEQNLKDAEILINESLENDWFYLMYQPQFTLGEKKLRGFETLIRCKKPDGSIVSPGIFIPAAEKSNLILKIDDYVLKRAIQESKALLADSKEKCTISINVSAKNISSQGFAEKVIKMIEEADFPPECLEIEITEYSFVESLKVTTRNITKLREFGAQIALDDFGTGYTSIAQVMNLPVNLLKIDKSLIDEIESSQKKRNLVNTIINMGHIMNCEVISEGVESEQQLDILRKYKCDFIQGYVWSKPIEYDAALDMCTTQN